MELPDGTAARREWAETCPTGQTCPTRMGRELPDETELPDGTELPDENGQRGETYLQSVWGSVIFQAI